jgi:hypothetical protein
VVVCAKELAVLPAVMAVAPRAQSTCCRATAALSPLASGRWLTERLVMAVLISPGTPTLRMSANSSQRGVTPEA